MKHFKNPENNQVYAFEEDGSQDAFIPANLVLISNEEAAELIAPAPVPESVLALEQIAEIERQTLMNRAVREFMLLSAEATAASHGVTPAVLYTVNPAYRAVKDVETQIAALRAKL